LFSRLTARIDDALNPIVIKELQQAVKSWFVITILLLFLLIQVIIVFASVASTLFGSSGESQLFAGPGVFLTLLGFLLGTCMLFLPLYAGVRLALERASDTNVDLLFITTLRPREIVWGKFLATMVLAVLIFSACMPFLTFTYLLRGIDLPTILLLMGFSFGVVLLAIQFGIFLASIPGGWVFKVLLALAGLGGLIFALSITIATAVMLVSLGVWNALEPLEFWGLIATCVLVVLSVFGYLFVWSVALISPHSANRSFGVRTYSVLVWLATGVTAGLWSYHLRSHVPIFVWMVVSGAIYALFLLIAISERDHWGSRIARTIPQSSLLRVPAFLLYSGSAGGIFFAAGMIALTLLTGYVWDTTFSYRRSFTGLGHAYHAVGGMGLYIYCYAMTALLLRRTLFVDGCKPPLTWVLAVILMVLGTALPFITAFLFYLNRPGELADNFLWRLGTPFAVIADVDRRPFYYLFAIPWAALVTGLSLPWFIKQVRDFKPLQSIRRDLPPLVIPVVVVPEEVRKI
jgi:hypothetical protein